MTSLSRIRSTSIALSASLLVGCSSTHWLEARARGGPDVAMPGLHLLAAEDELPPDETVPLLRLPPEEQDRADRPRKEGGSRLRVGVRGGVILTGEAAEREWEDATMYGVFLRQSPKRRKGVVYELGADYSEAQTLDGFQTSTLYFLRADILFGKFGPSGATVYFFLGGQAILEESTNVPTQTDVSGQGGGAEAGLGLGARSGLWDLKATYSYITATENADSNLMVSFGLAF
jgi:hypothetical protein